MVGQDGSGSRDGSRSRLLEPDEVSVRTLDQELEDAELGVADALGPDLRSINNGHLAASKRATSGATDGTETWKLIPRPRGRSRSAVIRFRPTPACSSMT